VRTPLDCQNQRGAKPTTLRLGLDRRRVFAHHRGEAFGVDRREPDGDYYREGPPGWAEHPLRTSGFEIKLNGE
jgi:hypothetical protein